MTLGNLDWRSVRRSTDFSLSVSSDDGGIMLKNTRLQAVVILAAGGLLGYLAASGHFPLGKQAAAAAGIRFAGEAAQATQQDEAILIKIRLPADAVLEIDGHKTTEKGEVRTFQTPPLPMGKRYTYNLKATSG